MISRLGIRLDKLLLFAETCKLMSTITCSVPEFTCVSSAKVLSHLLESTLLKAPFVQLIDANIYLHLCAACEAS